jgi:hypothetical protein
MSEEHSPGPWMAIKSRKDVVVYADSGRIVARTPCDYQLDEANARLIAAAPELLEHLRQWLLLHPSTSSHLAGDSRALIRRIEGG